MKKILALGLSTIMLVSTLTGCGKTSSEYLLDVDYSDYVKLCDYKGVEATKVIFEVTDSEIQDEIEYYMYDYVTYDEVTDRGVQTGDYVNIDYAASSDGESAEEYSGEQEDVMVGEGYIYPELEKALVGMETGERKTVEVELTEEFAEEEDVGKKLSVEVTVNDISIEHVPEYNDNFVQENTDYETMKEFEDSIREELEGYKEEEYKYSAIDEIMGYIIDNSEFSGYPQELYDQCKDSYDASNEYYAAMYGIEVAAFLDAFGLDEETQKQEIEDNVNYELVIGAIAQAEGISCTENDISEYINDNYEYYGYEDAESFEADYTSDDIGNQIIYERVTDFLYENAKYNEISEEEYIEQQNADSGLIFDEDSGSEEDAEISEEEQTENEADNEIQVENGSDGDSVDVEIDDSADTGEE